MWFSKTPKGESVALIDVNASTVGGALVRLLEGKQPTLCYSVRVPLDQGGSPDTLEAAVMRALARVGEELVRTGAPRLRACAGEGSINRILVSIASPWQEASVETRSIQRAEPFTFTQGLVNDLLAQMRAPEGKRRTQTIVATYLNGYLAPAPYGKEAHRAELIVLSSMLDQAMVASIEEALRSYFHTREVEYLGFAQPAYKVLHGLYPHERDFLLLSVGRLSTFIASIKRGSLIDTGSLAKGTRELADGAWLSSLTERLREFAARHALPRTLFLMTTDGDPAPLIEALNDTSMRALWLSDEPITIIPVKQSHFASHLKVQGDVTPDTRLSLLALYAGER